MQGTRSLLAAAAVASLLGASASPARAQVYGYTNDDGVLILSNVPSQPGMRLILEEHTAEGAQTSWHYSGQYDAHIVKAARLYGVDSSLVRAVIAVESAFNRNARSHKGAEGLMQLMPQTGRMYGVVNPYDPWQNIKAGTAHLKGLLDEFGDVHLALAAYNAGATPVRRYKTIPPYAETRNYVRKVMAVYRAGSKIQIVKGGNVYSITRPGGETEVSAVRPRAVASSSGAGSTLADVARRVAAARAAAQKPAPAPQRPPAAEPTNVASSARPVPAPAPASAGERVYYRYADAEGTIHITFRKPAGRAYEVLSP